MAAGLPRRRALLAAFERVRARKDSTEVSVLSNPYQPGGARLPITGRWQQRDRIDDHLQPMLATGQPAGRPLVFTGPDGIGKTSLLRAAREAAVDRGFLTVWVGGDPEESLAVATVEALRVAVSAAPVVRVRQLLERLDKVELSLLGAKLAVQAGPDRRLTVPPTSALEEALRSTAGSLGKRPGVVLFVDDVDAASRSDLRALLNALEHLNVDTRPVPVAMIAAGRPGALRLLPAAAGFGGLSRFERLEPLGSREVAEALRRPASRLDVGWSDQAVRTAAELTGGYPQHLALLAETTWDDVAPRSGHTIGEAALRRAAGPALDRMVPLVRSRVLDLPRPEQELLAALSTAGVDRVRDPALDRHHPQAELINSARQGLIDVGLIDPVHDGTVRLTVPGLPDCLRTGALGVPAGAPLHPEIAPTTPQPQLPMSAPPPPRPAPGTGVSLAGW